MSNKLFHINDNGDAMPCTATKRPCPVGGGHFPTADAARAAYEDLARELQDAEEQEFSAADDYFEAKRQGRFLDQNPEATGPEIKSAKNSTVQEAFSNGDSLRGFSTTELFDQLSRNTDMAHPAGRRNMGIREELNDRLHHEDFQAAEEQQFFGSVEEALLHHKEESRARREERLSQLVTVDDYFDAEEQGYILERNPETTSLEVERARTSSVREAVSQGWSMRGFTTQQLFDQFGSGMHTDTPHGRRNRAIRDELRSRVHGDYLQKQVSLRSDQDFRDAYDVGLFYPEGISDAQDRKNAWKTKQEGGTALALAEEGKDISGFSTEDMFAGDLSKASPKAKARVQNELRLRLKVNEAPREDSPF